MKKKYENLDAIANNQTVNDFLRWNKERRQKKKDLRTQILQSPVKYKKELQNNRAVPSITWVGHSTFLIQVNGLNILTDPVWARWMGAQKRLSEPGLQLKDLPEIDIVVISHGHYDHLDFATIRRLKGKPTFFVPAGLKGAFTKRGYKKVIEADWWDSFVYPHLKVSFVPAQHWTKRGLFDNNSSHWGGWILEDPINNHSIYFVGDTGYFPHFAKIGEAFGPEYVLMPIGAYEPEWFMRVSHINPEDAVKAFLELGGKYFIPMHYGAYRLADDTGPEALERLMNEWGKQNLPDEQLQLLKLGETLWIDQHKSTTAQK